MSLRLDTLCLSIRPSAGKGREIQDPSRQPILPLSFCLVWYQLKISHLWKFNRHRTWACQVNQSPIDLDQPSLLPAQVGAIQDLPDSTCYNVMIFQLSTWDSTLFVRGFPPELEQIWGICMVWRQWSPSTEPQANPSHINILTRVRVACPTAKSEQPRTWYSMSGMRLEILSFFKGFS